VCVCVGGRAGVGVGVRVCVCVYYTRIRILKTKDCLFLIVTCEYKISYKNSRHTWNLVTTHQLRNTGVHEWRSFNIFLPHPVYNK
jgi:hypothetical protein